MRRIGVATFAAVLVLLVGCGGSGGDGGGGLVDGVLGAGDRQVLASEPDGEGAPTGGPAIVDAPIADAPIADPSSAECSALRGIADLDVRAGQVADSGDPEELQRFLLENLGAAVDAYDVAIPAVPEMADQLTALRDLTSRLVIDPRSARTLEEMVDVLLDDDEIGPASGAAIELDRYAQERCGFSTGNN